MPIPISRTTQSDAPTTPNQRSVPNIQSIHEERRAKIKERRNVTNPQDSLDVNISRRLFDDDEIAPE